MVSLLPKDQKFFDVYERMTAKIVEGSKFLSELTDDPTDLDLRLVKLKEIEHEGDLLTHESIDKLNRTFLTPFDREDLHSLAAELDDILDWVEEAGQDIGIFKCTEPRDDVRHLASIILRASEELHAAMTKLRSFPKQSAQIRKHLIEINRLENEGDVQYRNALGAIFEENGRDPLKIMKWKEILDSMEAAIDAIEQVAHTLDSILIKHS